MRVLRFMGYPIDNFSTLEIAVASQARALRAAGGTAVVAFDGVARPAAAEAFAASCGADALHVALPAASGGLASAVAYGVAAQRLIRAIRPDVVHAYFGMSAAILNELAGLHPRTRFLRTIGSSPIASARGTRYPRLRRWKWHWTLRGLDAVVCVAPHIRDMLRELGLDAGRMCVIPNPTDIERFRPRGDESVPDRLDLAYVGRLDPIKNLETLVRGVVLANSGDAPVPVSLMLYGTGPSRDALQRLISELRATDAIRLAGRVDDVPAALARARVYVQASWHEGCPAAVGEAMAAGLPLLLSDIAAHRSLVQQGTQGEFFDPRDPASLAQAIRLLWQSRCRLPAMGRAARAHAERALTPDRWVEQELKLYESLLSPSGRAVDG